MAKLLSGSLSETFFDHNEALVLLKQQFMVLKKFFFF